MKTGFFNGSFDILNVGHLRAIRLAQRNCDKLVVGVNSDELMTWFKRVPIMPWEQRKELVEGFLRPEDFIIKTHEPSAINYLMSYDCDLYILTEEWKEQQQPAIKWIEARGGKVIYSPRWSDIMCSSDIRAEVRKREE